MRRPWRHRRQVHQQPLRHPPRQLLRHPVRRPRETCQPPISQIFPLLNEKRLTYFPLRTNIGAIIGGTLGGVILLVSVFGFCYLRKRNARRKDILPPESALKINPFVSEYRNNTSLPWGTFFTRQPGPNPSVSPFTRSAILRDVLAAGVRPSPEPVQSSRSIQSRRSSVSFHPLRRPRSSIIDIDPYIPPSNASRLADAVSPFSDPQNVTGYNFTAEQLEVIDRLRADNVPADTVARVIEGFATPHLAVGESSSAKLTRSGSLSSALPPPSYQTRDR